MPMELSLEDYTKMGELLARIDERLEGVESDLSKMLEVVTQTARLDERVKYLEERQSSRLVLLGILVAAAVPFVDLIARHLH